jgi:hypothetical protein
VSSSLIDICEEARSELEDKDTLDKYIGTIFTKQVSGFKPEITYSELTTNSAKTTMKSLQIV